MKIIIGAMKEELNQLVEDVQAQKVVDSLIEEFYQPSLDLTIAWTGVGMTNAALGLTYLLTKYQDQSIEMVINAGTACGVDLNLNQNDFVLVNHAYFSTADATAIGYNFGQVPSMEKYYQATPQLVTSFQSKLTDKQFLLGNTGTSDVFFGSQEQVQQYLVKIEEPMMIVEMECASFFQVADKFQCPVLAIKIISDVLGKQSPNSEQFDQFLPTAASELSALLQQFIN